jgi:hypothetical protein
MTWAMAAASLRVGMMTVMPGIVGLSRRLVQIPRDLYKSLHLLARWRIYDNSTFRDKADETVIDLIGRFRESSGRTGENPDRSVGHSNIVFRLNLIRYIQFGIRFSIWKWLRNQSHRIQNIDELHLARSSRCQRANPIVSKDCYSIRIGI